MEVACIIQSFDLDRIEVRLRRLSMDEEEKPLSPNYFDVYLKFDDDPLELRRISMRKAAKKFMHRNIEHPNFRNVTYQEVVIFRLC